MASVIAEKPRILLLSTSYLPLVGGSELAIQNLTERMTGYDFDMVTGRYSAHVAKEEMIGRVRVFRVGLGMHHATLIVPKFLMPLAIFFMAWRLARKNNYVLVHAYQASQAAGAGWILSWVMPKLPFLVTIQEGKDLASQSWVVRAIRRMILRHTSGITVISEHLARYARSVTDANVSVVPNGVSLNRFLVRPELRLMNAAREHMGGGPHNRVIVSVSRLVPKNGIENLIRALPKVREELVHDEPILVLVGTGHLEGELKHLSLLEGVSDAVRFIGTVDHGSLPAYLHAAHVFARPSLSEGLGSAFIEAMAAGLPVVASRVGGIADFLEDGVTGFVCDPNSPDSIATAIVRVLSGTEEVETVRDNALELVRKRYNWDTVTEQMNVVYREMIHA